MHTIDYENGLNPAQLEAATTLSGPVLVIAGAGSGKTRTIVYRLARLVESGVPASSILLLTFTRKAAQEMLARARILLNDRGMPSLAEYREGGPAHAAPGLAAVQGGTFHSYAYSVLRLFQPSGYGKNLTVMDSHDILASLQHCREETKAGKGDRSFPRNQTIQGMLSKSRNKEIPLSDVVRRDAHHLLPHVDAMEGIAHAYAAFKRSKGLLDYDDLLFELERALMEIPEALAYCRRRHQYIMVDEYQDTNPVQARIACLVAGVTPLTEEQRAHGLTETPGNIMVVGDDAQSIYAFRGADVRNILRFPEQFKGAVCIRLEENYRSTQPILDFSNGILENAAEGFKKHLFTSRGGGDRPHVVRPLSDRSQAILVVSRIVELLRVYPPQEIAVLFRSGFHSYAVEVQMNKMGIRFRKYGGIRYAEAAHIKDAMSYMRLILNPLDFTAFSRMADLTKGIGAKTCLKIYRIMLTGDRQALEKAVAKYPGLQGDLQCIDRLRACEQPPAALLSAVIEQYQPRLEALYPDDYPRRLQGLEQLVQIAAAYSNTDLFIADLSLDDPLQEQEDADCVVLSTIHSSKGLEWPAVIILDLVEERFPSRQSMTRPEDYEEERRLMYVACTRAKDHLELYVPATLYDRGSGGSIPAVPSPFLRELSPTLYEEYQESYTGGLVRKERPSPGMRIPAASGIRPPASRTMDERASFSATAPHTARATRAVREAAEAHPRLVKEAGRALGNGAAPAASPEQCGYCNHRIFGRGKIVQYLPPDKYRVNFAGIGLKVIMAAYLTIED